MTAVLRGRHGGATASPDLLALKPHPSPAFYNLDAVAEWLMNRQASRITTVYERFKMSVDAERGRLVAGNLPTQPVHMLENGAAFKVRARSGCLRTAPLPATLPPMRLPLLGRGARQWACGLGWWSLLWVTGHIPGESAEWQSPPLQDSHVHSGLCPLGAGAAARRATAVHCV